VHVKNAREDDGCSFINSSGTALDGDGLPVVGDIYWREGFHAEGTARLMRATVTSNLECDGGTLHYSDKTALHLVDDLSCWPLCGNLKLDGFVDTTIVGVSTSAKAGVDRLERQPPRPFSSQPYQQLAKVLRL
jgi:hypothetical protein